MRRGLFQDLKDVSDGDWNPLKVARLLRCSERQARRYVAEVKNENESKLKESLRKIRWRCPPDE